MNNDRLYSVEEVEAYNMKKVLYDFEGDISKVNFNHSSSDSRLDNYVKGEFYQVLIIIRRLGYDIYVSYDDTAKNGYLVLTVEEFSKLFRLITKEELRKIKIEKVLDNDNE